MSVLAVKLQPAEATLLFGTVRDYLLFRLGNQNKSPEEILANKLKLALTTREVISDENLLKEIMTIIDWALPEVLEIQTGWRLMDLRQKIEGATSLQVVAATSEKKSVDYERL